MKNRTVLNGLLAIVTVLAIAPACSSYGTRLEFNGDELFYTENVTEAEAKALGNYLVNFGLFKGDTISAQLDKAGATYQVKLVMQPGHQNDLELRRAMRILAIEISIAVFSRAPTEIHGCNDQLKLCKAVPID